MDKRKLTEKAARIPDPREAYWRQAISTYLAEVEALHKEPARSHRFAMLMQQLLGMEPGFIESYSAGIERSLKVRQKDRILRGEADNLFGNVILEFEAHIPAKLAEAQEQLRRYVAILWSQEPPGARRPYLCIATDGVRFVTYSPLLADHQALEIAPEDLRLEALEETDWTRCQLDEIFYWLDRHFLRKEILHPTSELIVRDFGVKSHALQTSVGALLALWRMVKAQSAFAVIYESWEKYLRIVYGSSVAGDELFLRHTYLATLAKLMSWMRISESPRLPDEAQIVEMLEGRLFKAQGIENFIEEDFFSWLARGEAVKTGVSVVRWLYSLLQNYNLRELSEDVLKSLYQELVDPATRHDLGEFYTPDWLAHRMVRRALEENPRASLLDPACGSGTFLYLAIREVRQRLGDSAETLRHILDSLCGADIHPLAVIVAKTNYILALGDLLKRRRGAISIPVYLADTLRLPEEFMQGAQYEIRIGDQALYLPQALLRDLPLYDQAIELAKEFAAHSKTEDLSLEVFRNYLLAQRFPLAGDEVAARALFAIAETLKRLLEADRDTIWAFVLKNIYKPLFFRQRFDVILGNPPWIAFRYMEPAYQAFLKQQIVQEYQLLSGRGELITHLEVATLFLLRAADLYLKDGGRIAFVLPRSLFSADQHDGLRRRTFRLSASRGQTLLWRELWDCEGVAPLFNVPSCVLFAQKAELPASLPPEGIPGQVLRGKLEGKNASLAEAESALQVKEVRFSLNIRGKRSFWVAGQGEAARVASYYKARFAQGATIVPRSFWFVQVKPSPLGFNPDLPPLETAARALEQAKDAYKDVLFRDTVESRFLYATLLSTDLLPFGHLGYRLVVLPIEPEGERYRLLDADEARRRGYLHLARWLERVEEEWARRRSAKAERVSALGWLDYRGKLTAQHPRAPYRVLYNTSGTFLTAAVIADEPLRFEINGQQLTARGFLADTKTYCYETSNGDDAYYIASVLNAPATDELVKPMQSRGLFGPRDIHKKVLELPIPAFDAASPTHKRLAELGEACTAKVATWLAGGGAGAVQSIGRLRSLARQMLAAELAEIDALVQEVLKEP